MTLFTRFGKRVHLTSIPFREAKKFMACLLSHEYSHLVFTSNQFAPLPKLAATRICFIMVSQVTKKEGRVFLFAINTMKLEMNTMKLEIITSI